MYCLNLETLLIKNLSQKCNNVHLISKILYLNPRGKLAVAKLAILMRRSTYHVIENSCKGLNTWLAVCVVQSSNNKKNTSEPSVEERGKTAGCGQWANVLWGFWNRGSRCPGPLRRLKLDPLWRGKYTKTMRLRDGRKKKTSDGRRAIFYNHCCWLDKLDWINPRPPHSHPDGALMASWRSIGGSGNGVAGGEHPGSPGNPIRVGVPYSLRKSLICTNHYLCFSLFPSVFHSGLEWTRQALCNHSHQPKSHSHVGKKNLRNPRHTFLQWCVTYLNE